MLSTATSTNQPLQQQQLQSATSNVPPALALGLPAHMQGYLQSGDNSSSSQSPLTKSLEEGFVWVEPQFEPWPLAGNSASNQQQQQYHSQQQQQQQQWYYSNQQQQQLQGEPLQRAQLQQQQQQYTRSNSSGNAVLTPTVTASKRKSISSGTANCGSNSSNNVTATGAMVATASLVPLEALARCLHVVELFGKRAVLLAHLGDANVSTIYIYISRYKQYTFYAIQY
jgi:hypothetical protein